MGRGLGIKEHSPLTIANTESSFHEQSLTIPARPAGWVLETTKDGPRLGGGCFTPVDGMGGDMKGFTKEEMKMLKKHFDADPRLKALWEKSFAFQHARGDGRHAENVIYFTAKLLEHGKEAEAQVALPAAIIHDIGWYWMTPEEHRDGLPYGTPPEILKKTKKKHEELGVKNGRRLLQESGYTQEEIKRIIEIVDGHDTRAECLSPSDGIMRDADRLTRFSRDGFWSEMVRKRGMTKEDKYKALLEQMSTANYFYSPYASRIARQELEKRVSEGF